VGINCLEISFAIPRLANPIGRTQAASTDGSERHCNGPEPKRACCRITPSSFQLVWPNPSTAPTKALAHGWRGRELCARIDLKTDRRWLCHGWQHSSPHDHHGRATASAQQWLFQAALGRGHPQHPAGAGTRNGCLTYPLRPCSWPTCGGSVVGGKIRRLTMMTIAAP
jgi:hypothetical protein